MQQRNLTWEALFLRTGLGGVFFFFGLDKLPHPERWVIYYPIFLKSTGIHPYFILKIQGIMEVCLGLSLLAGFFTRLAAVLAAFFLIGVIWVLGWDPIAIRDFGLFFSAAALAVSGPGQWSLDEAIRYVSSDKQKDQGGEGGKL